jgi:hypothetical protein
MRNAKFYKVIMDEGNEESGYTSPTNEEIDPSEEQRGSNHEASL